MKAKTRMFGEIDIQEDKIITLESGMIGFPDMQKFTLIFDEVPPIPPLFSLPYPPYAL